MNRLFTALALLGITLFASACGSSGSYSTASTANSTQSTSTATAPTGATTTASTYRSSKTRVTDDQMALAMANAALQPYGLDCGNAPTYQDGALDPFWSVGGQAVAVNECLGQSYSWGVEYSYSLTDAKLNPVSQWSSPSNGPVAADEGEYDLVGGNFVLTFGTSDPKVVCAVQKSLPLKTQVVPRGAPAHPC